MQTHNCECFFSIYLLLQRQPALHFHYCLKEHSLHVINPLKWRFREVKHILKQQLTLLCVSACVGKQARVMATIGVTRGLGDHDLKVYNSNIYIKPFLSCVPEVSVRSVLFLLLLLLLPSTFLLLRYI